MVSEYRSRVIEKTADSYMLTVARDGESPARSIYFYGDAVDAATGYAAYTDWGFAKDFLTVELYEPTGRVHSKVLRRPRGGECAFHREQYYRTAEILGEMSTKCDTDSYNKLVYEFAKLFSKDNQRFQVDRFLTDLGYTGEINDQH
jgi:hypothetical protein